MDIISTFDFELPEEMSRQGYVYLIWSSFGLYKIGRTSNVEKRFAKLKYERYPDPLKLIFAMLVQNQFEVEEELHRKFRKKRVYGEWFDLDEYDLWCFAVQAQVYIMQTLVEAKFWLREEITDDDCRLMPLYLDTPHGQIVGDFYDKSTHPPSG